MNDPPKMVHRSTNPARNSIIFVTGLNSEVGKSVVAIFELNQKLNGDTVHKATSIHKRESVFNMLKSLGEDSVILVKNKNEFEKIASQHTDQSPELLAKIKFIDKNIKHIKKNVNNNYSGFASMEVNSANTNLTDAELTNEGSKRLQEERTYDFTSGNRDVHTEIRQDGKRFGLNDPPKMVHRSTTYRFFWCEPF